MSRPWPPLPAMHYLPWAIEHMPKARLDLATSGVPTVPAEELGAVPHISEWRALDVFRQAVAGRYGVSPAEVAPALGAAGGLAILVHVLAGPGDEVVVERPAYEPLVRAIEARGAQVRPFSRGPDVGWRIQCEAVEAALGPRTRLVLVSNPHNPSGVVQSDEELRPLADMLAARGIELAIDEVYRELVAPARTARRLGDHVSVTSSLTKCFGLGWARAGWVMARPEVVARVELATLNQCGVPPATIGAYGAAGLRQADALLARGRAAIEVNARRVRDHIAASPSLRWTEPDPALPFGFVQHAGGRDVDAVTDALRERGVLVVPGRFFGVPSGFRMSWMVEADRLEAGLREIDAAFASDPALRAPAAARDGAAPDVPAGGAGRGA